MKGGVSGVTGVVQRNVRLIEQGILVLYPKVAERVGQSPPQYPDWDDER